jgi:hypothetical protein
MDYQLVVGLAALIVTGYGVHHTRRQTRMMEAQFQPRAARRRGDLPKILWWKSPALMPLAALALLAWAPFLINLLFKPPAATTYINYGILSQKSNVPLIPQYESIVMHIEYRGDVFYNAHPGYKIVGVAFHDKGKNQFDTDGLQKSEIYDVTAGEANILIHADQNFITEANSGAKGTIYELIFFPPNIANTGFATLNQAKAMGGTIVTMGAGPP